MFFFTSDITILLAFYLEGTFEVHSNATPTSDIYGGHVFDLDRQFLIINTTEFLSPGTFYMVNIPSFVGPLIGDLAGLYLSSYTRGDQTM